MTSPSPKPFQSHPSRDHERSFLKPLQSIALQIATDQGLPEEGINRALTIEPWKVLVRNPAERNISKINLTNETVREAVQLPVTDLDDPRAPHPYQLYNDNPEQSYKSTEALQSVPNSIRSLLSPGQPGRVKGNEQERSDEHWKKQAFATREDLVSVAALLEICQTFLSFVQMFKYDVDEYVGPFGFDRSGSLKFYIVTALFTLLSGALLIMTGVFYLQSIAREKESTSHHANHRSAFLSCLLQNFPMPTPSPVYSLAWASVASRSISVCNHFSSLFGIKNTAERIHFDESTSSQWSLRIPQIPRQLPRRPINRRIILFTNVMPIHQTIHRKSKKFRRSSGSGWM